MKFSLKLLVASFIVPCYANYDWESLIEAKKDAMGPEAYDLITRQYRAYLLKQAPKIADHVIRSIPTENPDDEQGLQDVAAKKLIDIKDGDCPDLTMLPNPTNPYLSPDYSAGTPYASQMRAQTYFALKNMDAELCELSHHFGFKPSQVSVKVFECLRDINTQKYLFEQKIHQLQSQNPAMNKEEAYAEAATWISPVDNNIPAHCTGGAVALRLWNNFYEKFLDMGQFGDVWGENKTAPTFSEEITNQQKNNRLYALTAAVRAGLTNYPYEHWHFSVNDRYHLYWKSNKQKALAAICPETVP